MGKMITLLFVLCLAIASLSGYVYLNNKINTGQALLDAGQKKYDEGQAMLKAGRAKLAAGKHKLSRAKKGFGGLKLITTVVLPVTALPVGGAVFHEGDKKLAEGSKLVASGEKKVREGQAQLAAGKIKLEQGRGKLAMAKQIRLGCAYATGFFSLLLILLLFCWRKLLCKRKS
ncbi:MAG: hypothetical protein A3E82_09500 [Gammaproteobacteria bacterium RIFCSPHIGHO2_12_FULL_38_11]|nr:MAG: hypothetical protein A3E82_09500 [Gammaproteobacteria bacterium RIFCSPHIGHO2_12_FULL_38_11]